MGRACRLHIERSQCKPAPLHHRVAPEWFILSLYSLCSCQVHGLFPRHQRNFTDQLDNYWRQTFTDNGWLPSIMAAGWSYTTGQSTNGSINARSRHSHVSYLFVGTKQATDEHTSQCSRHRKRLLGGRLHWMSLNITNSLFIRLDRRLLIPWYLPQEIEGQWICFVVFL